MKVKYRGMGFAVITGRYRRAEEGKWGRGGLQVAWESLPVGEPILPSLFISPVLWLSSGSR